MSIVAAGILLFLVTDPFGNVPFFLCVLKDVPPEKRPKVIIRELLIALLVNCVSSCGSLFPEGITDLRAFPAYCGWHYPVPNRD